MAKKIEPSRVAAALQYLQQMRDRAADFGGGVVDTLADRARSVGGLAYEALTSDPNMGRMTTAEYAQAAAARAPTPRLDATAQGVGALGKALVTQPVQTAKAVVVDPIVEAFESPRSMGQFAGEFVNPLRIAAALRKTAPIAELDVYHGTPHQFPGTEENPLGEFDASKIGTGEGVQAYGHGIYLAEDPDVAKTYQSAQSPSARKATMTLQASDGNVNKAIAAMKKEVATMTAHKDSPYLRQGAFQETQDALNYLQQMKKGAAPQTGALYTADLPDEMIDRMLDWDKPLSEQSPAIKKAMGSRYENWKNSTGQDLYETLSEGLGGDKVTSDWLRENNIPGIRYLDADKRLGGSGTRNFVVFPGEEKKVRILERDGQKAPPQKIAQALEAAPTLSVMEQRIKERFGDFAQAYNLGLPDTPEYRRIVQEVTAQGPLSDDALREAVKLHPAYLQAGGKSSATELRQANRGGASALVDSLSGQGIKTRVETSKSPGSRSTYIYASKGDKTVKIRLSDHLPAESGRVYGANDIMTTPQHWKSAAKRALKLLGEER